MTRHVAVELDENRAARIRAEVSLITRFRRSHRAHADYPCPLCGTGMVAMERTAEGKTAAACSRPHCISLEE